jgi:hypothetical protein
MSACRQGRVSRRMAVMMRTRVAIVVGLTCLSCLVFAQDAITRQKNETVAKADKLFGERYTPAARKPLRLYDEQTETGPPDGVIYRHGAGYVIELLFAADGSVAKLRMLPEALLHSDTWSDVPNTVELLPDESAWFVDAANKLQPVGGARNSKVAPKYCAVSGPNWYCYDPFEFASVSHYYFERVDKDQVTGRVLREIEVSYRQSVVGVVEDVAVEGNQHQLKVAGQWYHGEKPEPPVFAIAQPGTVVHLVAYGCTANQKACLSQPEQSKLDSE